MSSYPALLALSLELDRFRKLLKYNKRILEECGCGNIDGVISKVEEFKKAVDKTIEKKYSKNQV